MAKPFAASAGAFFAFLAVPATAQDGRASPAWFERSDAFTQQFLEMDAQFSSEGASQTGLEQHDGLTMDIGPDLSARYTAAAQAVREQFVPAMLAK